METFLQAEGLTRSVGDRVLFHDIQLSIAEGQHIGLIARNGTGKSTLLNILAGKDTPDAGQIVLRSGIRVGYLEQTPSYPMDLTVMEACFWHGNDTTNLIREYEECLATEGNPGLQDILDRMDHHKAWDYETRSKQILGKLKIHDFDQPLSQLSGGQLKRVALANVLITEPELIILDEPTNHLDLEMIEWLEGYLNHGNMSMLLVTHDRYFLDNVCHEIVELDDETLYHYRGNYQYYLEKREERLQNLGASIARANNLYRTELEWMRRMPQARGHKARYREEAFYELEKLAKQRIEQQQVRLQINSGYIGSKIFEAQYVSKAFPGKPILKDFYYNFSRYEKMGIVGGNGTGKSTFVKMLLGEVLPDEGRFVVGETVRFGYFSQDGMQFDEQMKVIDAVRRVAEYVDLGGGRHLSAMQFLQHFMFTPLQQQNYIYKLSGGEKRRLHLCTVLMQAPNFLVLDEPTNDLDITTLQVLEQYLADFRGCVIVVSHDRYFMDRVVDHLLVFQGDGQVQDFPGNYTQYREYLRLEPAPEKDTKQTVQDKEDSAKGKPRLNERKPRLTFKQKQQLQQLENEIEVLEAEKSAIETALCSGALSVEELTEKSKRLPILQEELDDKSMQWLELSELEA